MSGAPKAVVEQAPDMAAPADAAAPPRQHAAFDALASTYDASFTRTALGAALRALVWERLDAAFAGRRRILEIGCGTGEDAVHLARRGLDVVATDPSSAILRAAQEKARRARCAGRIEFRHVAMERLAAELAGERFDGVLSNFGAINCVPRLDDAVADLAPLVDAGAPLVFVVMGRDVPWEWAWFLARGEWRKAFRRRRANGVEWRGLQIRYPPPAALARALGPYFAPVSRRALGLVLPPSYASAWLERAPRTLGALVRCERALQRVPALAALADHYILEARRRPAIPHG